MKKLLIYGAVVLLGAPILIVVGVATWDFIEGTIRAPELYEFQPGYRGWVIIQYEVPSCPPLEERGRTVVYKVPPSGCLCTSSPTHEGVHTMKYEYVNPNGTRTKIPGWSFWESEPGVWDGTTAAVRSTSGMRFVQEVFFVGSKKEFEAKPNPAPNNPPIVESPKLCDELEKKLGRVGERKG